jgi:hypothetical protein
MQPVGEQERLKVGPADSSTWSPEEDKVIRTAGGILFPDFYEPLPTGILTANREGPHRPSACCFSRLSPRMSGGNWSGLLKRENRL